MASCSVISVVRVHNQRSVKPIHQLAIYALALSRLIGQRLYGFKYGWLNQDGYFEFFPRHIVHKLRK